MTKNTLISLFTGFIFTFSIISCSSYNKLPIFVGKELTREEISSFKYSKDSIIPYNMELDSQGNIFASTGDDIRKITPEGKVSTFINVEELKELNDKPITHGRISFLKLDSEDNIYCSYNYKLVKITKDKKIELIGGTSKIVDLNKPFDLENIMIHAFTFKTVQEIFIMNSGLLVKMDSNKKITVPKDEKGNEYGGYETMNIVIDSKGNIYHSYKEGILHNELKKYSVDGKVQKIPSGRYPSGLAIDDKDNIYFVDSVSSDGFETPPTSYGTGNLYKLTPEGKLYLVYENCCPSSETSSVVDSKRKIIYVSGRYYGYISKLTLDKELKEVKN